jgi:tetratricopeptide (TPR) repeat protein
MKRMYILFLVIFFYSCIGGVDKKELTKQVKRDVDLTEVLKELKEKKKYDEILKLYDQRKHEFNSVDRLCYLVLAFFHKGKYDRLADVIEKNTQILKISGDLKNEILSCSGIAYFKLGKLEQAQVLLELAFEQGLEEENLVLYLTVIYMKKGQFSNAMRMSAKLTSEKKDFVQGLLYLKENNFKRAIEKFRSIENHKAQLYLAYSLFMIGSYDQAFKVINDKKIENAKLADILKALILLEKGEVKKARYLLESLKIRMDLTKEELSAILANLGLVEEIYFDNKDVARKYYENSLELYKNEQVKGWLNN